MYLPLAGMVHGRGIAGGLEHAAEQHRLIDDLRASALEQRRNLSIGEVTEGTSVIEEKLELFCHAESLRFGFKLKLET